MASSDPADMKETAVSDSSDAKAPTTPPPGPPGPPTPPAATNALHPVTSAVDRICTHASTASAYPPIPPVRETLFILVAISTQLLTQAAFGSVLVPTHLIGAALDTTSPGLLSWFSAAYSLTVGTFILAAGRLGDRHGHRRLLVAGWAWLSLWSLVAGFAAYPASPVFFVVCRALQGVGPAAALPAALAILGRTYAPGRKKRLVFAAFGATAPMGFVVGAVFGSAVAEYAWWPWGQWILALWCAALALLAAAVVPADPPAEARRKNAPGGFDVPGAVLGVSGLILFNVAWNQAPLVGWQTPYVIVLLLLGVLLLAAFGWHESRTAHPLFPTGALTAEAAGVVGLVALGWASFGAWVYYTIQLLEMLRGTPALLTAAMSVPVLLSGGAAALVTGWLLDRVHSSWLMCASLLAFTVGGVLTATAPVAQVYWANIFVGFILTPWGMDISFPASTLILSDIFPRHHQGVAASLITTVVNYSISIGLGIAGTVESRVNDTGDRVEQGYRAAMWTGVGLAGLGLCFAVAIALARQVRLMSAGRAPTEPPSESTDDSQERVKD